MSEQNTRDETTPKTPAELRQAGRALVDLAGRLERQERHYLPDNLEISRSRFGSPKEIALTDKHDVVHGISKRRYFGARPRTVFRRHEGSEGRKYVVSVHGNGVKNAHLPVNESRPEAVARLSALDARHLAEDILSTIDSALMERRDFVDAGIRHLAEDIKSRSE